MDAKRGAGSDLMSVAEDADLVRRVARRDTRRPKGEW